MRSAPRGHLRALAALLSLALLAVCRTDRDIPAQLTTAYGHEACASCDEWNEPQRPFRVHGNTYYVGTRGLGALLITSSAGHVLVDGGLPATAPQIVRSIRQLGFDESDVKWLLNSHAHFDHAGGLAALQRLTGARVLASRASADIIRRGNSEADDPQYGGLLPFPPIPLVDVVADGEPLALGDIAITPHLTPAHVPGGTTWTWRSCEDSTCLAIVYGDSQSLLAREGFRFSERADLAAVERGFGTIERLACDVLITPHPGASSFWERHASATGLVDPGACARYAKAARERLARRLVTETARQD